jgi:hypothetical protein
MHLDGRPIVAGSFQAIALRVNQLRELLRERISKLDVTHASIIEKGRSSKALQITIEGYSILHARIVINL